MYYNMSLCNIPFLVTLSECDSSDHTVSVVVNFCTFSTSHKLLHGFASNVW